jgi:hypothetical protein
MPLHVLTSLKDDKVSSRSSKNSASYVLALTSHFGQKSVRDSLKINGNCEKIK